MIRRRYKTSFLGIALTFAMLFGGDGPRSACADLVKLSSGGEIRGEVEPSVEKDGPLIITTLSGARVSIPRTDIEFVEQRTALYEEYVTRSRKIPDTVEAHWKLAEWCRVRRLRDEQTEQLEQVIELDPDHEAARGILRHVRHNGIWMSREEMMTKRGYIQHKGRWITQQEFDLINKTSSEREAELEWYPRIRLWLAWVTANSPRRRAEGVESLKNLRDGDAIAALDKFLGSHRNQDIRLLMIDILKQMEDQRVVLPLVEFFLYDGELLVRRQAMAVIGEGYGETALPYFVKALRDDTNQVVNRAGEALGQIGDDRVVPVLIESLITTHKYKVDVPAGNPISVGTGANGQMGMVNPSMVPPEIEMAARTGQLPYGAVVHPPNVPRAMKTVTVRASMQNIQVLNALEKITGENFGYDERAWLHWWTIKKG